MLLVEAACLPGRGTLHFTGMAGPMMREAANVAVTWVRSHAERLAGAARLDDSTDVHVHLAEAARWKDGPSAGVALADPLEPLRDVGAPDEIVRSLAEVMVIDELVGSGRAARVTGFKLGASLGGFRKLELEWEPRRRYANERRVRRHSVVGRVRL